MPPTAVDPSRNAPPNGTSGPQNEPIKQLRVLAVSAAILLAVSISPPLATSALADDAQRPSAGRSGGDANRGTPRSPGGDRGQAAEPSSPGAKGGDNANPGGTPANPRGCPYRDRDINLLV